MADENDPKRDKLVHAPTDLISDLPREIIDNIVERLPLRDFARMSIVSDKWRRIWTSMPRLVFDSQFSQDFNQRRSSRFTDIISSILFHHDGPIVKFSLHVPNYQSCPNVTQWLSFVSRSGIKDFSIANHVNSTPLKLTSHLFSSVELEYLKLRGCVFSPPTKFIGFSKLVSLELHNVIMQTGTVGDFIRRCPLLEALSLINCNNMEVVKIDAPKLRNLVVSGTFTSLSVEKPQNLVSVYFTLDKFVTISPKARFGNLIEAIAKSLTIEEICFGGHFCKVLSQTGLLETKTIGSNKTKTKKFKVFGSIKSLILRSIPSDNGHGFSAALKTILCCPNIEKLEISVQTSSNPREVVLKCPTDFKLHRLSHAKVSLPPSPAMDLKLVEFVLDCSPALQVLELSYSEKVEESVRSLVGMLLNQYRRASPTVNFIIPADSSSDCETESSDSEDSSSDDDSEDSSSYVDSEDNSSYYDSEDGISDDDSEDSSSDD